MMRTEPYMDKLPDRLSSDANYGHAIINNLVRVTISMHLTYIYAVIL